MPEKNKILQSLEYSPRKGSLTFKNVRYMIVRPETIVGMQKAAERALGSQAAEIFYEAGFTGGYLSSRKYRDVFGLKPAAVARFMAAMGGEIGWGGFSIVKLDLRRRRLEAVVRNSPFAEAHGKSRRPVCHVLRGIFGGLCEVIFDRRVRVAEIKCAAKGDGLCRFRVVAERERERVKG
ncbi:MAG: V4R domain-containing protein [Planctomycetota bacterium]|nr:V4R domain-containing protein [Planctomycetota bacterium]